jgi:cation diffusion facilitator family transporter
MHKIIKTANQEKRSVALFSVFAAIFITLFKLAIGIMTRSLGILSEALHSGLDLIAAVITYFSVRVSDKPPDEDHNYGHGKIENLSALFETFLLLITCVWIIYEAVSRLTTGDVHIKVTIWSYIVMSSSIAIDFTRSRALYKAAKKHNSQALEADALHFSTDIWSSSVVLLGLICANFGFFYADSVAALVVAMIVILVCYKLGKRAVDILLDKSPQDTIKKINEALSGMNQITDFHDLKVRTAGADIFIEMNIHVNPELSIADAHEITHNVEEYIKKQIGKCEIHIHTEPEKIAS